MTAPASGSVKVGGTTGGDWGYGVNTIEVTLTAGTRNPTTVAPTSAPTTPAPTSPAPTTPAPTTPAPTHAPVTNAPTRPGDTSGPTRAPSSAPATSAPVTQAPVTQAPVTQAPVTPPTTGAIISFTGYMADTLCLGIVNSNDGVNASRAAPNHTVSCMLKSYCIDSGFTMLAQVGDEYVARYQLDAGGVTRAVAALNELDSEGVVNNVAFTVTGEVLGPARYRNELTYGPVGLGMVLRTTGLVAETPGPLLAFPGPPSEGDGGTGDAASSNDSTAAFEGGTIAIVIIFALLAVATMVVAETKGAANEAV